jgi:kynurenine formamidase
MCVPGCQEFVTRKLSRRGFFKGVGGLGATAAAATVFQASAVPARAATFTRAVDLTHTLSPDFPTFSGIPAIEIKPKYVIDKDGYNLNIWTLEEHVGTHMDAPLHFARADSGAQSVAEIPVGSLVVPLCVIDVKAKAAADPNYMVTADDIATFEAANGAIPAGACVAMNAGWSSKVGTPGFRNANASGAMNFPGFSKAATDALSAKNVVGIAVDTLSLDPGNSKDFAVHTSWLPSGHWGLECVANLDDVPVTGATLVVGAPKVKDGTGGPSRLIALV